jgi:HSP20 family protein
MEDTIMASTSTDCRPTNGHNRLPHAIDRLFQDIVAEPAPTTRTMQVSERIPCNLVETWANYVLQIALPGIDPTKLQILAVARQVTVLGKYHIPPVDNGTYLWQGLDAEEFSQVFTVPAEVDGDKAQARFQQGILTIWLPKVAYLKPKSIPLKTVD